MRKKVIVITDGDEYARRAIRHIASELGGTSLDDLAGNPTRATKEEIIKGIERATSEPVFVLVDDAGVSGIGAGESILLQIATHPSVDIIGALAVASHTKFREWSRFDFSIDLDGNLVPFGVDKEGVPELDVDRISGDTVYALDQLTIPTIVAIGDIGKMRGRDDIKYGAPVTKRAIELILERDEQHGAASTGNADSIQT
ncbi:stage V sporulation protein AE [Pontibacillus halophilus]|nr:stage V sporulation protein AE [Pontibacillus halophilus]